MAKLMTYAEAISRFANLATTGIGIAEAIQEAVDRIYEMGRWPGTTVELELAEADFIEGDNANEWFLYLAEETYDGAIGFRTNHRGWAIVDHTALYRDGVNSGDAEFLDMGTVDYPNGDLYFTGDLTSDGTTVVAMPVLTPTTANSPYVQAWTDTGDWDTADVAYWLSNVDSNDWFLTAVGGTANWSSTDAGVTWTAADTETGTPVLVLDTDSKRKYRAPLGFVPSNGPYFALMKLEAPDLVDATVIPIHSAGALKCAILAVCQEYVNDDDRAMLNWQKFESFITKAAKQVDGPKRWSIGMDSSLRRKPSQFL